MGQGALSVTHQSEPRFTRWLFAMLAVFFLVAWLALTFLRLLDAWSK